MWAQVPLRLSLQPLLLESLWRRWAPSKMILSKNCPLSLPLPHPLPNVCLLSPCVQNRRKKEIGKITLKRLQRVSTVMADQQVLDIANRRTVRKGLQGWPKQMLPPNSAREGLWNWIVEPDYTCALTSMIARTSPALLCTQFQATKATALCLFVVKLRLGASPPCHQVIVCQVHCGCCRF